jgi:hypothetical protein
MSQSPWHRYKPRHVDSTCSCPFHRFEDTVDTPVTAIYLQGGVPLIRVSGGSVELLNCSDDTDKAHPFVAISHVRSQGLGNWCENSLPLCQLARLQDLSNSLFPSSHPPVPFWIDTACIPLTRPGNVLALEKLGYIFRTAEIVLALDVFVLKFKATSAKENLSRIQSSQWAKRLWTIREGALGKRLRFQFKDTALDLDAIVEQYSADRHHTFKSPNNREDAVEDERASNTAFLECLLLFERDIRAAIGRTPPKREPFGETKSLVSLEYEIQLQTALHHCYRSTLRYRHFWTLPELKSFEELRTMVENLYKGMDYDSLLRQQDVSLVSTLERLEQINTFMTREGQAANGC